MADDGAILRVNEISKQARDLVRRRTDELLYGQPHVKAPALEAQSVEADGQYGVSSDRHTVTLSLGDAPAFKVSKEGAIKLGMLILKHAGVTLEIDDGQK